MENNAYYCKDCNYQTQILSSFKKHLISSKHNENSKISIENIKNFSEYNKKLFHCKTCDKIYLSKRRLEDHIKICINDNNIDDTIKKLKNELHDKNKLLKIKDDQLNNALTIAKINSKTTNASVNILKYANMYLNDAEPLNEICGNDIYQAIKYCNPKGKEDKNEEYVKTVIHKFRHGIFANFVSDMIIEYYKPKIISDVNLIASDTSRLCFIIMQKVKNKNKTEKKEWINDKSGPRFFSFLKKEKTTCTANIYDFLL